MAPYIYSARSSSDLEKLSSIHKVRIISDLAEQQRGSSANLGEVQNLLDIKPSALLQTERELLQSPGGFFLVALAQASYADVATATRIQPSRERTAVDWPDYSNSLDAIVGSSSPTRPSSSDYEIESEYIGEDENEAHRTIREVIAVNLVVNFLRYVLQCCLKQDDNGEEIRARANGMRDQATVAGVNNTFEDDAGMSKYIRQAIGWALVHPYMALIEAKRAQGIHIDSRTGRSSPVVSNDMTAQYLGEAVLAWRANRNLLGRNVFLIAVSNTFVQFIHFSPGRDYDEYLNARTKAVQKRLVDNKKKDTFVRMRRTKWFDLRLSEGRRIAMCHVLMLVWWHASQDAAVVLSETDIGSDENMQSDDNDEDEYCDDSGHGDNDIDFDQGYVGGSSSE
ncbi:hypothetical protein ED733_000739 [Metarhizium rileyi]|uniref:Uncharacterized protein n=1 Tax=Metarhizium rileyi (strain RCEF 4871) TaxID=1649241 RepID=A0A5C6G3X4_METRR|nr:hypothetical protein ED733_000739 [Metarhizium rileyi]